MYTRIQNILKSSILILTLGISICGYSQTVDEKLNGKQKNGDSLDYNYQCKYHYLDINMKEENNLFSFGIAPTTIFSKQYEINTFSLALYSTYEKKIFHTFSLHSSIVGNFSNYSGSNLNSRYFITFLNLGGRYFYAQKRKIKMNIAAQNFNGPYIDFTLNNLLSYRSHHENDTLSSFNLWPTSEFKVHFFDSFSLSWGYQQKITKFLLMDGGIFLTINTKEYYDWLLDDIQHESTYCFSLGLSFKIAFGLGWK
jgi:hypothetical protein